MAQNANGLSDAIETLRAERGDTVSVSEIGEIVESLLRTMDGDLTAMDLHVYRELEELAHFIRHARDEIAAIQPTEIREHHIPTATDELDAIVNATEDATGTILDAAEQLEQVSQTLDAPARDQLSDVVTRIYEACNFQDITGQRITKVVKTLQHIEEALDKLVGAFGDELRAKAAAPPKDERKGEDALLNGPQLSERAATQEEIDALLASFD